MYERYPISGIKQSYCPVPGPRTVVMPLLISALVIGLIAFYFKGNPPGEEPADAAVSHITSIHPSTEVMLRAVPVDDSEMEASDLPLVSRDDVAESDFTPWMSPLAIDTYIRQKNRGYQRSFWERGNWIKAVEGRWNRGANEFRIALVAPSDPGPGQFDWQYRIGQTRAEFSATLSRLRIEGYTLSQSHAYDHPDGTKRFQGVWQRDVSGERASLNSSGLNSAPAGQLSVDIKNPDPR